MTENKNISDPCVMLIFGATGDLTKRKLFPALYNLAKEGHIPDNFAVLGVGRQEMQSNEFRDQIIANLKEYASLDEAAEKVEWFCERTFYVGGDFNEDQKLFEDIKNQLQQIFTQLQIPENILFYMAIPPDLFLNVTEKVVSNGLGEQGSGWRRFIYEKPFGHDYESARELNQKLLKLIQEEQIYRIDHYLGKETVQNLLVFRFGNSIFEPIWNRNYIDHVQITVAETLGVEGRGNYYEKAGALKDMVPNHIFQLVTLTSMEPPVSFDADSVRSEQTKILHAIQPFTPEEALHFAVRGQYGAGEIDGKPVVAYREEENVAKDSNTETFAALRLMIDNWRWADVPFYVRTGKRLPVRHSNITIQFKKAPFVLFRDTPIERLTTNRLEIHIQPDEGITLHFGAKIPGPVVKMGAVDMDFNYSEHFGTKLSTGYERLLFDCMIGDATLFQRADMIETAWKIVMPVIDVWQAIPARDFPNYAAGTWGPPDADRLLEQDGRKWKNLDAEHLSHKDSKQPDSQNTNNVTGEKVSAEKNDKK